MVVDLVTEDIYAAIGGLFDDGLDGLAGIDGPRRIVGRGQHNTEGAHADGVDHRLRVELVAMLGTGGNQLDLPPMHADQRGVGGIGRIRHQELPTGGRSRRQRQIHGLGGAGGDHDVVFVQWALIALAVIILERAEELGKAGIHGIAGLPCPEGIDMRIDDMRRGREVRLTDGEMDDVLHGRRQVHHFAYPRYRDGPQGGAEHRLYAVVAFGLFGVNFMQVGSAHLCLRGPGIALFGDTMSAPREGQGQACPWLHPPGAPGYGVVQFRWPTEGPP